MPVDVGHGDSIQDTIDPTETVVARHNTAVLIVDTASDDDDTVHLSEIDHESGRVRIYEENPEDVGPAITYTDTAFESFKMARLAFGLWVRCGPFTQPEEGTGAVPVEIATEGQAAIAAYLRVGNGYPNPRGWVADKLDVTDQTVSNYCNRVRWTPDES